MLKQLQEMKTVANNNIKIPATIIFAIALLFSVLNPTHVSAAMNDVTYERVVAHAGGAIDGHKTTNSLEAVEHAIKKGFKNIEIDLALSSDGGVIAVHDWESQCMAYFDLENTDRVTTEEFSKLLVYGKYQTLTFEDIAEILRTHPEIVIITDTKEDNLSILKRISEKYPDVIDRIYPQIYSYSEYNKVKEMGFKRIILTLYKMGQIDVDELVIFATCNKYIYAVTMNVSLVNMSYCRELMNKGVVVYTHTVNDYEATIENRSLGCYGVYTDHLSPRDFNLFNTMYYPVINIEGQDKKVTDVEMMGTLQFRIGSNSGRSGEFLRIRVNGEYFGIADSEGRIYEEYPVGITGTLVSNETLAGKHDLEIEIFDQDNKLIGVIDDYSIWLSDSVSRLASSSYGYRLVQMKDVKSFEGALVEAESFERDLLRDSFIAKSGEYAYYNAGITGEFKTGHDYLVAREDGSRTMLPLSATSYNLGFDSVEMDSQMRILMAYNGIKAIAFIGEAGVNIASISSYLSSPLTIYNDRTYAPADLFNIITGRQVIDSNGIIIVLPEGISLDLEKERKLTETAAYLYAE